MKLTKVAHEYTRSTDPNTIFEHIVLHAITDEGKVKHFRATLGTGMDMKLALIQLRDLIEAIAEEVHK